MAENELQVRIGADYSALKTALAGSQKSVKNFAATFHDVQGGIQATISNVQRLVGAVQAFIAPALEAEKTTAELTAALKAQGVTSTKVRDGILAYSTALQRQSTYGDEAITGVQKLLFQLGNLEGDGLKRATKATLDLAAGLGIDLHSAALMVGKAAAGNTTTLGRYGIVISKTGDQAKDCAAVLDQLEGKFGGAAAAAAQTAGGAFAQFKEATGDLVEILGSKLLPSLATAAQYWRDLAYAATDAAATSGEQTNLAAKDAELLASAMGKIADKTNQYRQATEFLTAAEVAALRGSNLKLSTWADTGTTLQALLPKIEKLIALNKETAVSATAQAAAQEKQATIAKATGMTADELTAFLARLDHQGDETAIALTILTDREKELRAEMSKMAKAGERIPAAMSQEAAALREKIELLQAENDETKRASENAREGALARVKHAAAMRAEAEERDVQARGLASEAVARRNATASTEAQSLELQKQQQIMVYSTLVAGSLADAFVGIALEGESAADTLRNTFRQLAMDIVRQAIAMIVAKAGEAAAKTIAANAGIPGPAGIALAVGGGAAIFAAAIAYKSGIPGFARGGIVDGPGGRDAVVARLTRGEEVLTRQDPRHQANGGGVSAPPVFNFYSVFPPDEAEMEVVLRDRVMPVWRRLERRNM